MTRPLCGMKLCLALPDIISSRNPYPEPGQAQDATCCPSALQSRDESTQSQQGKCYQQNPEGIGG
jgi:hypothetical protein